MHLVLFNLFELEFLFHKRSLYLTRAMLCASSQKIYFLYFLNLNLATESCEFKNKILISKYYI